MDYNRVQSYIKSHVLPKLDSLPDYVQSVKNAFDVWKADWTQARAFKLDNLDAKVSTRATAADMGTALERVGALQTNLQNVTERVETIEKDVRNDAKMHVVKGVIAKKNNKPNPKELIMSVNGKGTLYCAKLSNCVIKAQLIVELDGKVVSIVNNSLNKIDVGISTHEIFYTVTHDVKEIYNSRIIEVPDSSSISTYAGQASINGITKRYIQTNANPPTTVEEALFADKNVNIVIDQYQNASVFGRYKGYPFEKSLKVYADYSAITAVDSFSEVDVIYSLEG